MNIKDIVTRNDSHLLTELKVAELTSEFLSLAASKQPPMIVTTEKVAKIRDYIHRSVGQMVAEGVVLDTIGIADIVPDGVRFTIKFTGGTYSDDIPALSTHHLG